MGLICECDDDGPALFKEDMVKAKKQHKCCECCKPINPGDVYEYAFGVWGGDAGSFHTCEKCSDLRQSLIAAGFCLAFGELQYGHQEYLENYVKHA